MKQIVFCASSLHDNLLHPACLWSQNCRECSTCPSLNRGRPSARAWMTWRMTVSSRSPSFQKSYKRLANTDPTRSAGYEDTKRRTRPCSDPSSHALCLSRSLFRVKSFLHCISGILKEDSYLLHMMVAGQFKVIEHQIFEVM